MGRMSLRQQGLVTTAVNQLMQHAFHPNKEAENLQAMVERAAVAAASSSRASQQQVVAASAIV
jgi:hypothetical protein